jgi:hypothetical protein
LKQSCVETDVISDAGISTLQQVFEPLTMGNYIRQALADQSEAIQIIRCQVLKHHPGNRCTFEIAFGTAQERGDVIGKVYAADRSDVYRAMVEIRRAGFGAEKEFSIPKPLAYVPGLRLLLQEKVQGPRVKQVLLTGGDRDRAEAAERCARWLVKFHTAAPRSGAVLDPVQHAQTIEKWSRTIATLGEPLAAMAECLFARLAERAAATARKMELCAGHGSYNCNQIILTESQIVTFDWDSYDVADPCRDVARFLVTIQRLALKYLGSVRALDSVAKVFLRTYQTLSPFKVEANLPWYRALTCLRLCKYEANRPVCTFRDGVEVLLSEGLHALEA